MFAPSVSYGVRTPINILIISDDLDKRQNQINTVEEYLSCAAAELLLSISFEQVAKSVDLNLLNHLDGVVFIGDNLKSGQLLPVVTRCIDMSIPVISFGDVIGALNEAFTGKVNERPKERLLSRLHQVTYTRPSILSKLFPGRLHQQVKMKPNLLLSSLSAAFKLVASAMGSYVAAFSLDNGSAFLLAVAWKMNQKPEQLMLSQQLAKRFIIVARKLSSHRRYQQQVLSA